MKHFVQKGNKMNYRQWLDEEQKRVNTLPIFWAFSNQQFDEALAERKATAADVYRINDLNGAFCLKKDIEAVRAYFKHDNKLEEHMKDKDFAVDAFYYEMCNHEYGINYYQRNWDVLNCFSNRELKYREDDSYMKYLEEMKHTEWIDWYAEARHKYYEAAEEGGWF